MFLDKLEEFQNICIQCHDGPDADTIGAGFALYDYFEKRGKTVYLIYTGIHRLTKPSLKIMVDKLHIPLTYVRDLPECQLLVTVDCQYRGGNVGVFPAENVSMIDHHPLHETETDLCVIRSQYGSCCTLVWELLQEVGYDPNQNQDVSTALYYGLYSDTGQLSEIYFDADRQMRDSLIYNREIMETMTTSNLTREELKIAGEALLEHTYNATYRYALVPTRNCDPNLLGVICDLVNQAATIDACVAYNETSIGYKLSVRSSKNAEAAQLIEALVEGIGTGGGHANKAGGMIMKRMIQKLYQSADIYEILDQRMKAYMEKKD